MTLKEKLDIYFSQNPIDDLADNKYEDVIKKFKISLKLASNYWNRYKRNNRFKLIDKHPIVGQSHTYYSSDVINITKNIDFEVKSLDDLLAVCEVETDKYEVISWESQKKDIRIGSDIKPVYTVRARFKPRKEVNLETQKKLILNELFNKSPRSLTPYAKKKNDTKTNLLELDLFDVHFGKLANQEESGENYNIKIAIERWNKAVESLLNRVNIDSIERILLPLGNDLIHVDNFKNTTTAGTPQDTDGTYVNLVRTVKDVVISTINKLKLIAPVDVLIVSGNHDRQTMLLLGDILDAYYHNDKNVNIENKSFPRKYYKYGNISMLFTHGDKENFNELGMIFATENSKLWADTKQRYIKIGHLHHNKKLTYNTSEFQGFTIQIIPSLSSSDQWHASKGYNSLKQAKAFLYSKNEGLIGEFSYTVQ